IWRNAIGCPDRFLVGCNFAAKQVLEFAVVLLGASVDFVAFAKAGGGMIAAAGVAVVGTILVAVYIGRLFRITKNTAVLVGVGNGICGNSAIAAVAPIVKASPDEVAASIGFTAVLSIFMVLLLPVVQQRLHLSPQQYGVVAGLCVYAVPQVLAATFAVSPE